LRMELEKKIIFGKNIIMDWKNVIIEHGMGA
jgi:hypothetical protein